MEISNHSYEFYRLVVITVPVLVPLVVPATFIIMTFSCGCIHKSHAKIFFKFAEKISSGEEKKYYLYREKQSGCIVSLLVAKGVLFLMFSLAMFLNESIIAHGIHCYTGHWDCFTFRDGQPIRTTNCSNLEFSGDSIQCYRPAFEYSTAISKVGGLIFVVYIASNIYVWFYYTTAPIRNCYLRVSTGIYKQFLFFILAVVLPIFFASYHAADETKTLNNKMHNIIFAIYIPVIYTVVTLAMLLHSRCTFDDVNIDYDPNKVVITGSGQTGANGATNVNEAPTTYMHTSYCIEKQDLHPA